ncbi:hypothetical protein DFH07DRAFT_1016225 [Mycena maculata]|uniref:Uncharacterized protein n=1 Tax=Mycena maculata TaxID=230809 RepID=A0AAD7JKM1_9AGAR|nr:hypothetical protein DFH07DRAFT_1016225 [Mycena maculata]
MLHQRIVRKSGFLRAKIHDFLVRKVAFLDPKLADPVLQSGFLNFKKPDEKRPIQGAQGPNLTDHTIGKVKVPQNADTASPLRNGDSFREFGPINAIPSCIGGGGAERHEKNCWAIRVELLSGRLRRLKRGTKTHLKSQRSININGIQDEPKSAKSKIEICSDCTEVGPDFLPSTACIVGLGAYFLLPSRCYIGGDFLAVMDFDAGADREPNTAPLHISLQALARPSGRKISDRTQQLDVGSDEYPRTSNLFFCQESVHDLGGSESNMNLSLRGSIQVVQDSERNLMASKHSETSCFKPEKLQDGLDRVESRSRANEREMHAQIKCKAGDRKRAMEKGCRGADGATDLKPSGPSATIARSDRLASPTALFFTTAGAGDSQCSGLRRLEFEALSKRYPLAGQFRFAAMSCKAQPVVPGPLALLRGVGLEPCNSEKCGTGADDSRHEAASPKRTRLLCRSGDDHGTKADSRHIHTADFAGWEWVGHWVEDEQMVKSRQYTTHNPFCPISHEYCTAKSRASFAGWTLQGNISSRMAAQNRNIRARNAGNNGSNCSSLKMSQSWSFHSPIRAFWA